MADNSWRKLLLKAKQELGLKPSEQNKATKFEYHNNSHPCIGNRQTIRDPSESSLIRNNASLTVDPGNFFSNVDNPIFTVGLESPKAAYKLIRNLLSQDKSHEAKTRVLLTLVALDSRNVDPLLVDADWRNKGIEPDVIAFLGRDRYWSAIGHRSRDRTKALIQLYLECEVREREWEKKESKRLAELRRKMLEKEAADRAAVAARLCWMSAIRKHQADLYQLTCEVSHSLKPLSVDDLRLSLMWAGTDTINCDTTMQEWTAYLSMYPEKALTMWSARTAENVAREFLQSVGYSVNDVAISQLTDPCGEWRTHDIVADERPIDVKNSRNFPSRNPLYVEHRVKTFKRSGVTGKDVAILGVVSDYVSESDIENDDYHDKQATVLGEFRWKDLMDVQNYFAQTYSDLIDLSMLGNRHNKYPGWMFEYSLRFYARRDDAISKLRGLIKSCPDHNGLDRIDYPWLRAILGLPDMVGVLKVSDDIVGLHQRFVLLAETIGLRRRSLFIWCLCEMLRAITIGRAAACARQLKALLFNDRMGDGPERPAALLDPQRHIFNIVELIDKVAKKVPAEQLREFAFFRMTQPTILRGQGHDGVERTIFAHCNCGHYPIYMGESETCHHCGFLICTMCHGCARYCKESEARKLAMMARNVEIPAELHPDWLSDPDDPGPWECPP